MRAVLSSFNCYVPGEHEEDKDDEGELAAQLGAEPLSAESQVEEEQKLVQSEILGYREVLAAAIPRFPSFPFQEWLPFSFSMLTYMHGDHCPGISIWNHRILGTCRCGRVPASDTHEGKSSLASCVVQFFL